MAALYMSATLTDPLQGWFGIRSQTIFNASWVQLHLYFHVVKHIVMQGVKRIKTISETREAAAYHLFISIQPRTTDHYKETTLLI